MSGYNLSPALPGLSATTRTSGTQTSINEAYPPGPINDVLARYGQVLTYADIESVLDPETLKDPKKRQIEIDRFMAHANQTPVVVIGEKPDPAAWNEPDTFLIPIPGDRLSIRLFPGGTRPQSGMFFFDFFDARRQVAVNAPQGYTVTVVWPHALAGPLASLEVVMGVTPDEGFEKFTVTQNVRCSLARPHREAYLFDIPARAPEVGVGQAVPYSQKTLGSGLSQPPSDH